MPKTAVKEAVCNICGAEVRDASLFCYNCGGSVSKVDDEPASIPAPTDPIVRTDAEPDNGSAAYEPAKRRSEQVDKRRVRAANRQPVEIVWQPRAGISLPFVITSLVVVVLALAIIAAALYFR